MDDIFRDKLSDFGKKPPEEVFSRISQSYIKPKAKPWYLYGIAGTVAIVAVVLSITYLFDNSENNESEAIDDTITEITTNRKDVKEETANNQVKDVQNTDQNSLVEEEEIQINSNNGIIENEDIIIADIEEKIIEKSKQNSNSQTKENTIINNNEELIETLVADAGVDQEICGFSTQLGAKFNAPRSYGAWIPSEGVEFISDTYVDPKEDPNAIIQVSEPGQYTLTWTENSKNNIARDEVNINFYKTSGIELDIETKPSACNENNGSIEIIASGGSGEYTYTWLNNKFDVNQTVIDNAAPGKYQVKVKDTRDCEEIFEVEVAKINEIEANFELTDQVYLPEENIDFVNNSSANSNTEDEIELYYSWDFGNKEYSTEFEPYFAYTNIGDYKVTLKVYDDFGCYSFLSKTIHVSNTVIDCSANIFTPNGDNANDMYRVRVENYRSFNAVVFSRYGEKIYQWDNPEKGWDGKIFGNKEAKAGVYYIVVEIEGNDGEKTVVKKLITLVRER
jgi:gliding motility-associated-like protein